MSQKIRELVERYERAMHAMQSGVASFLGRVAAGLDPGEPFVERTIVGMHIPQVTADCTAKALRVGVNSALVNSTALGELLIKKGLITEEEYLEAMAIGAEREKATYEALLTKALGGRTKVTLA